MEEKEKFRDVGASPTHSKMKFVGEAPHALKNLKESA